MFIGERLEVTATSSFLPTASNLEDVSWRAPEEPFSVSVLGVENGASTRHYARKQQELRARRDVDSRRSPRAFPRTGSNNSARGDRAMIVVIDRALLAKFLAEWDKPK